MLFVVISLGLLLDQLLGEPKRYHPLVGFGHCANHIEKWLNTKPDAPKSIILGLFGVAILILPLSIAGHFIHLELKQYGWILAVLVIYWATGFKSLLQHSEKVAADFNEGGLKEARHSISLMVSRDTATMDDAEVTRAAIESTLENGCDATFGVLFWYVIGGVPMVILYRLSNTLDAMWGYRNQRFELFGKSAAKLDDLLNYLPARLTAVSYALCGNTKKAFSRWRVDAKHLASPNGGPVMATGAGSLNIKLGGPASYHGEIINKPFFGGTEVPQGLDILRANKLLRRALLLWCFAVLLLSLAQLLTGLPT